MTQHTVRASVMLAVAALAALTGCPTGGSRTSATSGAPGSPSPAVTEGLDFQKVAVGLPIRTLDYIGSADMSVSGAKEAGVVFYAVRAEKGFEIYSRDLSSLERKLVTSLDSMQPGTLLADSQGRQLAYSRFRTLSTYIDQPGIQAPTDVAVPYVFDLASGEEQALFDFRQAEWLPYRNYALTPQMSHSGRRIAALSYDYDRSLLMQHLDEWHTLADAYFEQRTTLSPEERSEQESDLRSLLVAPHVEPLLREQGLTPSPSGAVTDAERSAMRALSDAHPLPQWAVLLWDAGTSKLILPQLPTRFEAAYISLIAVGEEDIWLAAQDLSDEDATPQLQLLRLNTETGATELGPTYSGLPSSMVLDADESTLTLIYDPFDAQQRQMRGETHVRYIPLDGGEATELSLGGNFAELVDMTQDGQTFVGQVIADQNIYRLDSEGNRTLLLDLSSAIDGLFLSNDGRRIAYLENGILFALDAPEQPEQSEGWVDESQFAQYEPLAREYLTQLGFSVPEQIESSWEEVSGLGLNQANGAIDNPARPEKPVLLTYNRDTERFESAWFPAGYPFEHYLPDERLDAPAAERRARQLLDRVGWLSELRQIYQPGPEPLFDSRTGSHVVSFRDGYMTDTPLGEKWVVNADATLRISQQTGQIEEISLDERPRVDSADFKLSDEEIAFSVRNKGDRPIPENSGVRFDTEGRGLIVAPSRIRSWGPAFLEQPGETRLAWEVDGYLDPEGDLIMQTWVDVENGDVLGQLFFMPTGPGSPQGF